DHLTEVASSSTNSEREMKFRKILLDIAKKMGEDDLTSLKEQCWVQDFISKQDLEKKKTAFQVFQALCEQTIISVDNTETLEELLNDIKRKDLVKFVLPFSSKKC
ncbi:FAS-associated death domain protein-like, partial [Saccoglossus kowalevskii]